MIVLAVYFLAYHKKRKKEFVYSPIEEEYPTDKTMIDIVNEHRAKLKLSILKSEKNLTELAREQAYWLELNVRDRAEFEVKGHYFQEDRKDRANVKNDTLSFGEITCYNYVTEKSKLYAYLNSSEHKETLEHPNFTHIGSATTNRINFIIFAKY